MLRYAMNYFENRWYPIPCMEKMAILPYRDLQPNHDHVQQWFQHHQGNIGILLKPSRLTILDADSKEAIEEVETLLKGHRTATVETKKGRHYYFQSNEETPNVRLIQKGECRKIDILSDGYIIAPPSENYEWIHTPKDVGVLSVTPNLEQYMKREAAKQFKTTTTLVELPHREFKREIDDCPLGIAMKDIIVNGMNSPFWSERGYQSRSHGLFAVICAMYQAEMDTPDVVDILTNPRYAITEKVLEQKDPLRWLSPQLEKAQKKIRY